MQAEPDYPPSICDMSSMNMDYSREKTMTNTLCNATWNNNMEVIRRLAEQEREMHRAKMVAFAKADIVLPCGFGPLHFAASLGNVEVLSFVLDNNLGNKNARDKDGKTPMMWAVSSSGSEELLEALVDHGSDVNMQDFVGGTALFYAASRGNADHARLLLENGACTEIANIDGVTPLHAASEGGHTEIVSLLIQYGAFVNAGDDEDDRPLHYAVREGHQEIVKLLLAAGADVELRNNDAESPLSLALCLDDKEMVAFLFSTSGKLSGSASPSSAVRSPPVDMMEAEIKSLSALELEASKSIVAPRERKGAPSLFGTTPPAMSFVC